VKMGLLKTTIYKIDGNSSCLLSPSACFCPWGCFLAIANRTHFHYLFQLVPTVIREFINASRSMMGQLQGLGQEKRKALRQRASVLQYISILYMALTSTLLVNSPKFRKRKVAQSIKQNLRPWLRSVRLPVGREPPIYEIYICIRYVWKTYRL